MTIFLTTHYMEEADRLCDRIGIIDYGKIQTIDTPQTLKNALGNGVIVISIDEHVSKSQFMSAIREIEFVKDVTENNDKITIFSSKGPEVAPMIFSLSTKFGITIKSISITQPTLDDVFLSYTGRDLRDDNGTYDRKKEYQKKKMMRI
jgi:ABC-2 type transport system ATP-binding protein